MNNLKVIRESKQMSQCELSKMLGVSQGAISQWESGECLPRAELLPKIASILECSIDDLMRESGKEKADGNAPAEDRLN